MQEELELGVKVLNIRGDMGYNVMNIEKGDVIYK